MGDSTQKAALKEATSVAKAVYPRPKMFLAAFSSEFSYRSHVGQ